MDQLLTNIKTNLPDGKQVIDLFGDYYERIKPLLTNRYDDDLENITRLIKEFPSTHNNIKKSLDTINTKLSNQDLITNIFDFGEQVQIFDNSIRDIVDVFNKPYMNTDNVLTTDMSQTYKDETAEVLKDLTGKYELYKKYYNEHLALINDDLIEILLNIFKFDSSKDDTPLLAHLQEIFHKYRNTVPLYANFIQKYIDYLYDLQNAEAKKLMYYVLEMVETDKDFLMSGYAENQLVANITKHNPSYKRFGLFPNTESLPLSDIFSIIIPNSNKYKTLEQLSKDFGVIVFTKIVPIPVEYNARKLLENDNSIPQTGNVGINKVLIERFRTIKYTDDKHHKYDFSIDIHNENAEIFYIFDTLDGTKYRVLTTFMNTKVYDVKRFRIKLLLKYLSNEHQPDRVVNYQELAINKSINCMFAEKVMPSDYFDENKESDTPLIRNELYVKLTKYLYNEVSKKKPKSQSDMNMLIHDDKLKIIFIDALYNLYQISGNRLGDSKFPTGELMTSFLVGLNDLSRQFFKLLHDNYNREPLGDDVFKLKVEDRNQHIEKKIEADILKCLKLLISDNDNVFSSVNYKYGLLNF